ncbi:MAG: DNA alkylation repair protein [Clostridia bacterium]|nr:DNA alkylation repair protein [Clostridia bacterium]
MIEKRLFEMQDIAYRDFQAKLMPTVSKDKIIGVRTPELRKFAKELYKKGSYKEFLYDLPHKYYEENNLHGFLIEQITDYDECINELNRFLPYIDNWACCDGTNPKIFKSNTDKLITEIEKWLCSDMEYTVRYSIKKLMDHYLGGNFKNEYLERVASVQRDEYYIRMMKAWFFATALAKQYDSAIVYLKEKRLPRWEHNKTVQKALESYRISSERKEELKKMRIK